MRVSGGGTTSAGHAAAAPAAEGYYSEARSVSGITTIVAVGIIVATLALLYGGAVEAGFSPKDDWEVLLTTNSAPLHPQLVSPANELSSFWAFDSLWTYAVPRDLQQGRFRPVYWAIATGEAAVLSPAPRLWHVETLLIGLLTSVLFYLTLRRLRLALLPALAGVIMLLFAADRLWVELQLAEELGLLLTAAALYAFTRGADADRLSAWDVLGLLSISLAGWVKESFALVMPALLWGRLYLDIHWHSSSWESTWHKLRALFIPAGIVFAVQLTIILYVYLQGGYGGYVAGEITRLSRFSPIRWLVLFGMLLPSLSFGLPLVASAVITFAPGYRRGRGWTIGAFLVFQALWVFPQILLYAYMGFLNHYKFPAFLAPALAASFSLHQLRTVNRTAFFSIYALSILALLPLIPARQNVVNKYVAETHVFERAIKETSRAADDTGAILLMSETYWDLGVSFPVFLSLNGVANPLDLEFVDDRQVYGLDIVDAIYPSRHRVQPENVTVITAFLDAAAFRTHAPTWFTLTDWKVTDYSVDYRQLRIERREGTIPVPVLRRTTEQAGLILAERKAR